MTQDIETKIEKYVEDRKQIKKEFESVISNWLLPLHYRWQLFANAPVSLKNHEEWTRFFRSELILPSKEINWGDDFHYDRYTTINTNAWVSRLHGKSGWTPEFINTFKEEILANNLGSFVYDW